MKRIVLFVEGEGESDAVPRLVKRIVKELGASNDVAVDLDTFRVGQVGSLVKANYDKWKRKLKASLKRGNVGGMLLLLDGDTEKIRGKAFCAAEVAKSLARESVAIGAGTTFSVAIIFARQEYETWLIASVESLAGQVFPDGRAIPTGTKAPAGDLENGPRNAKGWLDRVIQGGYRPTRDQATLTDLIDLDAIRKRDLRSFRRLESAIAQLVLAIRTGNHVASPSQGAAPKK